MSFRRSSLLHSLVAVGAGLVLLAAAPRQAGDAIAVDRSIAAYARSAAASGVVRVAGSPSVHAILDEQAVAFRALHPDVRFEMTGSVSPDGPKSLISGAADLAAMTRPMNAEEKAAFQRVFGHAPTEIVVALDAIAIFVHKDNPVAGLSMPQIAAVFGDVPAGSATARTWGELGLSGDWQGRPIVAFGFRDGTPGAMAMREAALGGGGFRSDLKAERVSSSIVNAVGAEPAGIGYASQAYRTKQTRIVPLAAAGGGAFVALDQRSVTNGSYPLARRLYLYANRKPGQPLPGATAEFLRFALSREGQVLAVGAGAFPISPAMASSGLAAVN